MENYHLFIVDANSLKYHLEYGFVGTGSIKQDFNIGLWTDIERLKLNDKIIFYVQGIKKFYGVFKVSSKPFFDNKTEPYLQNNPLNILNNDKKNIYLRYRALIEADEVFEDGIEEFKLIDILPKNTKDVLWSILYRKLKASRGNSPLFKIEFDIIRERLSKVNCDKSLKGVNFSFKKDKIVLSNHNIYKGDVSRNINVYNEILSNKYTEHHLHSILLEKLPIEIFGQNISWIGNEVYSGAGMQAIDILSIEESNNLEIFNIIEIKKDYVGHEITTQIEKYLLWIKNRFNNSNEKCYQPIIFGKKIIAKSAKDKRIKWFDDFNKKQHSLPIKYFEYSISNMLIIIEEIEYSSNGFIIKKQIQL